MLLDEAADVLRMSKVCQMFVRVGLMVAQAARRLFTVHGEEINSVHELSDLQELIVTAGESFSALARR